MEQRIKAFMETKGINAAELADTIGVLRSNVSHVLNGRNKPGFSFIEKLLHSYPDLNARWLLIGEEEMIKTNKPGANRYTPSNSLNEQDLFSQTKPNQVAEEEDPQIGEVVEEIHEKVQFTNEKEDPIKEIELQDKKEVETVIVFYTDKSFRSYKPE